MTVTRTSFARQILLSALLVALGAGVWVFRGQIDEVWTSLMSPSGQETDQASLSDGTPVIVDTVRQVSDDLTFSAIGTGFALRSVTLRAPSGGRVTDLTVTPGQPFAQGDLLLQLDDTDERLALDLAEARLERATSERARYRALQNAGTAAEARLEEIETNFKLARIEMEQARADLEDRSLRAPFDGVPGIASIEVGDRVAAEDAIAAFDDRSSILVEFDLPEAFLGRLTLGLTLTARSPSVEGQSFEGRITAIDSRVDPATRSARVRAAIDNTSDLLRPGASFSVRMELPGAQYPAVPELALQFSRGGLRVWRVTDGVAEAVSVRLIRRREGLVVLEGALDPGDAVVVEGTQRLRDGVAVDVLNERGAASS